MPIVSLKLKPQFIDACASWSFAEWGSQLPNSSLFKTIEGYTSKANDPDCTNWVYTDGKKPLGMIALKDSDHPDFAHWTPWLGSLFVHPQYRNQGIAEKLMNHVLSEAKNREFSHIHLFARAANIVSYYENRNWDIIGKAQDRMHTGRKVTLMRRTL